MELIFLRILLKPTKINSIKYKIQTILQKEILQNYIIFAYFLKENKENFFWKWFVYGINKNDPFEIERLWFI